MAGLASAQSLAPDTNQLHVRQMAPAFPAPDDTSTSTMGLLKNQGDGNQNPSGLLQFGKCVPLEKKNDPVTFYKDVSCHAYEDNLCSELASLVDDDAQPLQGPVAQGYGDGR
ncbi:unnamed protein product [Absidia cylindrospora]